MTCRTVSMDFLLQSKRLASKLRRIGLLRLMRGRRLATRRVEALMYCADEANRHDLRATKVLYERFENDPTVPLDESTAAAGVIFVDRQGRFYANVWGHEMTGPYDTWQAAAACAKLILDSEEGI